MSLISVENGDLWREWIAHLMRLEGRERSTPQIRTKALLAALAGRPVPPLEHN